MTYHVTAPRIPALKHQRYRCERSNVGEPRPLSRAFALGLLLVGISARAWADQPPTDASFEEKYCAAAKTQFDITQCAGVASEAADRELNAAYRAVLKKWTNYPTIIGKLRQAQRDWLVYRDADIQARFAFEDGEGAARGTAYPSAYAFYRASLERERTSRLCEYLRGTAVGESDRSACADLIKHPTIVPATLKS